VQSRGNQAIQRPGARRFSLQFGSTLLLALGSACAASAAVLANAPAPVPELDYVVDFWRTTDGLPDNTINAIHQTRDGYLWVGTPAGLARFDGLVFTVVGEETAPVLKGARITALLEDREGGLWIGTQERGAVRIHKGQVHLFTRQEGLTDPSVTSLAEDSDGVVWIGTQGGLHKWEAGRLALFVSDTLRPGEPITALHAGRSGVLWVTTRFEVYRVHHNTAATFRSVEMLQGRNTDFVGVYEDRAGNFWAYGATFLLNLGQEKRYNAFGSLDPATSRVWTIGEQKDGTFWIGTSGRGLVRFSQGRFDVVGTRMGLDQCDVRTLYADEESNLWIGTSGSGLARLRAQQWRILGRDEGLASTRITALTTDSEGELVVGTADAGILRWTEQRFEPLATGPPLTPAVRVRALCADSQGALWVGTWGAGVFRLLNGLQWRYTTADGLSDDVVLALAAERKGKAVWAGTLSGGLHRIGETNVFSLTTADGLPGRPITCLLATSDGSLLAGMDGGGLMRWNGRQLENVPVPPELRQSAVSCLMEDRAGRLWAGSAGAGAFCLAGGNWVGVGTKQGLLSDVITQVIQDDAGHFWFNTARGLCRLQARDVEELLRGGQLASPPVLSRREDGPDLSGEGAGWAHALRTAEGKLCFVTGQGLLTVDPMRTRVARPPRVMIERVQVDGKQVLSSTLGRQTETLRIGPGVRSLDFSFTAVSFDSPQKTRFRHMLEGSDLEWVESDTARRAHYGPVAPGRYRFRVTAANADGVWNEVGDSISIIVVPPFWRAWWFLTLVGLGTVGVIWAIVRYVTFRRLRAQLRRSEQQHAMERERTRIARDMHDEIGSKLTRISFLSEAARNATVPDNPAAPQVEAIANTSRELLQALDEIVWAVNPRNDNLEHLAGYLEQHAREYFQGTAVDCAITVPDQLPEVPLSAELRHNVFLAFEEALSNALQHAGATRVGIDMTLKPHAFAILVRDNGAGFVCPAAPSNSGRHDGLRNMRDRLRAVGGRCTVTSEPGKGTSVCLEFPLDGFRPSVENRRGSGFRSFRSNGRVLSSGSKNRNASNHE